MLNIYTSFFLCLFIYGCALPQVKTEGPKEETKKVLIPKGTQAVWYLTNANRLSLHLRNLSSKSKEIVVLEKAINQKTLKEGQWEIVAIDFNKRIYQSEASSPKFVFNIQKNSFSYAGSLVIGCPKVSSDNFSYLKSMAFFNRYFFRSKSRVCEIIIGNDRDPVRRELQNIYDNKYLKLHLGF